MVVQVGPAAVHQIAMYEIVDGGVEPARKHHVPQALVAGHLMNSYAGRRFEAGGAAVTLLRRALHPEFHILRAYIEFMLEHTAGPKRRGLLVFGHTDAFAPQV